MQSVTENAPHARTYYEIIYTNKQLNNINAILTPCVCGILLLVEYCSRRERARVW